MDSAMQKVSRTKDRTPMDVFIPERYLKRKEVLTEVVGHGFGIRLAAADLGEAVRQGRIAAEVISNRQYIAIY